MLQLSFIRSSLTANAAGLPFAHGANETLGNALAGEFNQLEQRRQ